MAVRLQILIVIIAGVLLSACDPLRTVSRTASGFSDVPVNCIEKHVREIDGVNNLVVRVRVISKDPPSDHGRHYPVVHTFSFEYLGDVVSFDFMTDSYGSVDYRSMSQKIGYEAAKQDVLKAREALMEIETVAESECGMENFSKNVTEECMGLSCPNR